MNDDATLHDDELRALAQRLGMRAAERLDVERAARAVIHRLREAPRAGAVWWVQPAWLRAAAAVVLVVGGLAVARSIGPTTPPRASFSMSEDMSGLSGDQLRDVLQEIDQTTGAVGPTSPQEAGLEDLTAAQLQDLLRALEG